MRFKAYFFYMKTHKIAASESPQNDNIFCMAEAHVQSSESHDPLNTNRKKSPSTE